MKSVSSKLWLTWPDSIAVDFAIVTKMGQIMNFLPHVVVSFATKFAAIYLGAKTKGESK